MRKLVRQDVLVRLTTSPQARKKCPQLPETIEARLLTRTINRKKQQVLTSMVDPMRFPGADIVELYSHRWGELGEQIPQTFMANQQRFAEGLLPVSQ